MNSWCKRCPFWQFILALALFAFLTTLVLSAAVQWLFFRLDVSILIGSAAGETAAAMIMGWAWRVNQTGSP